MFVLRFLLADGSLKALKWHTEVLVVVLISFNFCVCEGLWIM